MASELLHTDPPGGGSVLTFPASTLLAEAMPLQRLRPTLHLHLTDHTYVPKVTLPRSDWVSAVALPAFLAYRARYQGAGEGGSGRAMVANRTREIRPYGMTWGAYGNVG